MFTSPPQRHWPTAQLRRRTQRPSTIRRPSVRALRRVLRSKHKQNFGTESRAGNTWGWTRCPGGPARDPARRRPGGPGGARGGARRRRRHRVRNWTWRRAAAVPASSAERPCRRARASDRAAARLAFATSRLATSRQWVRVVKVLDTAGADPNGLVERLERPESVAVKDASLVVSAAEGGASVHAEASSAAASAAAPPAAAALQVVQPIAAACGCG